jgi:hypothetical protein
VARQCLTRRYLFPDSLAACKPWLAKEPRYFLLTTTIIIAVNRKLLGKSLKILKNPSQGDYRSDRFPLSRILIYLKLSYSNLAVQAGMPMTANGDTPTHHLKKWWASYI